MLSSLYDRGVMTSGSRVSNRGYWVPGDETKESAILSTGEFSNLICGDMMNQSCWGSVAEVLLLGGKERARRRVSPESADLMGHHEVDR
jgi:hypothetical protein